VEIGDITQVAGSQIISAGDVVEVDAGCHVSCF
jgi:hypothetical protein